MRIFGVDVDMYDILKSGLKSLAKKLAFLKVRIELKMKICEIFKHIKNVRRYDASGHLTRWRRLTGYVDASWFQAYSNISGIEDEDYAPEDIYYGIIEPILNDRASGLMFCDKNLYDLNYSGNRFPAIFARNIHGVFYDAAYKTIEGDVLSYCRTDKVIVKPAIDTGGGKGVDLFIRGEGGRLRNREDEELTMEYLDVNYRRNYVLQPYLMQHDYYAQFNRTSVNTVKVITYRSVSSDKVHALHAELRIGQPGSFMDNQNAGGVACLISGDARLNDYAVDKCGVKYFAINGIKYSDFGKIYKFADIISAALDIAKRNLYSRILGVDICVDKDGRVVVMEINNRYAGITLFQMSGKSFFGKFTDEVIGHCRNEQGKR